MKMLLTAAGRIGKADGSEKRLIKVIQIIISMIELSILPANMYVTCSVMNLLLNLGYISYCFNTALFSNI